MFFGWLVGLPGFLFCFYLFNFFRVENTESLSHIRKSKSLATIGCAVCLIIFGPVGLGIV